MDEAEYRAWLEWKPPRMAEELTERFKDVLPEGMHFEWTTADTANGTKRQED